MHAGKEPVSSFFARLAEAGHVPTFERNSATLRFDVSGDDGNGHPRERWYVTVTDGDVTVSHKNGPADAVVRIGRRHLGALVTGRLNATAAYLRGLLTCEGSMAAVIMFQRCLPGPPGSTGRIAPISSAAVTAERRAAG
ncbi:MAG TPA: SCP2 sterol-binding domain-containing protein [Streptosporangiaceae bacterium]|nr:SCP2 sterol-binding domain-containing protein [Streptosporangiaceae bacterium]